MSKKPSSTTRMAKFMVSPAFRSSYQDIVTLLVICQHDDLSQQSFAEKLKNYLEIPAKILIQP